MKDTVAADDPSALPPVVTPEEWQQARDALLAKEKRLTRALDDSGNTARARDVEGNE